MNKTTEREREILRILNNDPMISQEELAEMMGITRSAAAVHISNLMKKGYILGRGYVFNDKTGVIVIGPVFVEINCLPGGPETEAIIDIGPGGSGYLIAESLASQNVPVLLASVMGRDDWGGIIGNRLKQKGVDTQFVLSQNSFPTPKKMILDDPAINGKRIVTDGKALNYFKEEFPEALGQAVSSSRLLIVDSLLPFDAVSGMVAFATAARVPVYFSCSEGDTGEGDVFNADIFSRSGGTADPALFTAVLSVRAATSVTGKRITDLDDGIQAAQAINKLGIGTAVVVIPEQGVALAAGETAVTVPVTPVRGILTSLVRPQQLSPHLITAGLVTGILHGYDYRQSLRLGLRLAAMDNGNVRNLSKWQEK